MCYAARLWYKWCTFYIRGRKKCKIVTNEPTTPCLQCWLHIIQLSPIICLRCWNYWKTFSCVQLLWNSNGVWQKRWIQIGEVRKQTKGGIGVGGIATSPKSIQSKKIKWLYILTNDVKWKAATTAALSLKSLGNKGSQPTENKEISRRSPFFRASAQCILKASARQRALGGRRRRRRANMGILTLAPNMAHTRIRHTSALCQSWCTAAPVLVQCCTICWCTAPPTNQTFLLWWKYMDLEVRVNLNNTVMHRDLKNISASVLLVLCTWERSCASILCKS